jgi:hypothetical protein
MASPYVISSEIASVILSTDITCSYIHLQSDRRHLATVRSPRSSAHLFVSTSAGVRLFSRSYMSHVKNSRVVLFQAA